MKKETERMAVHDDLAQSYHMVRGREGGREGGRERGRERENK